MNLIKPASIILLLIVSLFLVLNIRCSVFDDSKDDTVHIDAIKHNKSEKEEIHDSELETAYDKAKPKKKELKIPASEMSVTAKKFNRIGMIPQMHTDQLQLLFDTYGNESIHTYFEFGTGGSAVQACGTPNIQKVVAVDSDSKWLDAVRDAVMNSYGADAAVKLRTRYIDIGPTKLWGFPVDDSHRDSWPNYSQEIANFPKGYFDLVLVDGRFRIACAFTAWKYMRPDSLLLFHDYEREPYHVIEKCFTILKNASGDSRRLALLSRNNECPDIDTLIAQYLYKSG